jgi:hypothetical protein
MIVFRLICAALVAWAANWALARPDAAYLISEVPEMAVIGPIAGAIAGLINLPRHRGGGAIAMTVNGAWTGVQTIVLAAFIYLTIQLTNAVTHGLVRDFENFLRILGSESKPLIETLPNVRLIGLLVGATAIVGLVTELVFWFLERIRRLRGIEEPTVQAKSTVGKAGGPLS